MNNNVQQLSMFERPAYIVKPKITYNSLSIHRKINYKDNECGIITVYRSNYNYYVALCRGNWIPFHGEYLNDKYLKHYRLNAGSEVRIKRYAQSKGQLKLKL
jgi:hypothetical protein